MGQPEIPDEWKSIPRPTEDCDAQIWDVPPTGFIRCGAFRFPVCLRRVRDEQGIPCIVKGLCNVDANTVPANPPGLPPAGLPPKP